MSFQYYVHLAMVLENKIDRLRETNPFFIRNNVELDGKEILLVDDIYTYFFTIQLNIVSYKEGIGLSKTVNFI
jgi:hypothetical protein